MAIRAGHIFGLRRVGAGMRCLSKRGATAMRCVTAGEAVPEEADDAAILLGPEVRRLAAAERRLTRPKRAESRLRDVPGRVCPGLSGSLTDPKPGFVRWERNYGRTRAGLG